MKTKKMTKKVAKDVAYDYKALGYSEKGQSQEEFEELFHGGEKVFSIDKHLLKTYTLDGSLHNIEEEVTYVPADECTKKVPPCFAPLKRGMKVDLTINAKQAKSGKKKETSHLYGKPPVKTMYVAGGIDADLFNKSLQDVVQHSILLIDPATEKCIELPKSSVHCFISKVY